MCWGNISCKEYGSKQLKNCNNGMKFSINIYNQMYDLTQTKR